MTSSDAAFNNSSVILEPKVIVTSGMLSLKGTSAGFFEGCVFGVFWSSGAASSAVGLNCLFISGGGVLDELRLLTFAASELSEPESVDTAEEGLLKAGLWSMILGPLGTIVLSNGFFDFATGLLSVIFGLLDWSFRLVELSDSALFLLLQGGPSYFCLRGSGPFCFFCQVFLVSSEDCSRGLKRSSLS